ncbi:hypothetical protein TB2_022220 [Malus domestica]
MQKCPSDARLRAERLGLNNGKKLFSSLQRRKHQRNSIPFISRADSKSVNKENLFPDFSSERLKNDSIGILFGRIKRLKYSYCFVFVHDFGMRISKTEVNLRRLLASAPQQHNQAKLVHYVAILRELVEQLAEERNPEGLPRVSKAVMSDYSEKIEAIASKLAAPPPDIQTPEEPLARISVKANSSDTGDNQIPASPGLRRRFVPPSNIEDGARETVNVDSLAPIKLDAAAQAHIEKHKYIITISISSIKLE